MRTETVLPSDLDFACQHVPAPRAPLDAEGIDVPVWRTGMSGGRSMHQILRGTRVAMTPRRPLCRAPRACKDPIGLPAHPDGVGARR